MRRLLFGISCFMAGLLALPFLAVGAKIVSARLSDQPVAVSRTALSDSKEEYVATPVAQVIAAPFEDVNQDPVFQEEAPQQAIAALLAEPGQELFEEKLEGTIAAPLADGGRDNLFEQEQPQPAIVTPVPNPAPTFPRLILPATPDMLLLKDPEDEAEAAKLTALRETLKKTIESKAVLLNADALQAEIAMHQRHEADLRALLELERLQKSLQELGDKYPESDAGRRAKEVLQLLKVRRTAPVYVPEPRDGFNSPVDQDAFDSAPRRVPNPREQPIKPKLPTY